MTSSTFTFLGTGASIGTPVIGCTCSVCTSSSPYDRRARVAGLIKVQGKNFLIDAGPDIRFQVLRAGVSEIAGLLITHTHFDHIAGLDDLRPFCFSRKDPIPCLLSQESLDDLKIRYYYLMQEHKGLDIPYTRFNFQVLERDFGACEFEGVLWRYVSYFQLSMKVTGYKIGNFAYISDIREYSDEVIQSLQGTQHLVVGALRQEVSRSHFSIDEAIAFGRKVGAKMTYITHAGHELDHAVTNAGLPKGFCLAYDGLEVVFDV
jgi:phosphoribosyl 1,2-cyclic phosphate phosphodiesterase